MNRAEILTRSSSFLSGASLLAGSLYLGFGTSYLGGGALSIGLASGAAMVGAIASVSQVIDTYNIVTNSIGSRFLGGQIRLRTRERGEAAELNSVVVSNENESESERTENGKKTLAAQIALLQQIVENSGNHRYDYRENLEYQPSESSDGDQSNRSALTASNDSFESLPTTPAELSEDPELERPSSSPNHGQVKSAFGSVQTNFRSS